MAGGEVRLKEKARRKKNFRGRGLCRRRKKSWRKKGATPFTDSAKKNRRKEKRKEKLTLLLIFPPAAG